MSNSDQATIPNPLSIRARHSKNLWSVMVYGQPPGCYSPADKTVSRQHITGRAHSAELRVLAKECQHYCLTGVNSGSEGLYRDNKHDPLISHVKINRWLNYDLISGGHEAINMTCEAKLLLEVVLF